jgi:hypothetical protein
MSISWYWYSGSREGCSGLLRRTTGTEASRDCSRLSLGPRLAGCTDDVSRYSIFWFAIPLNDYHNSQTEVRMPHWPREAVVDTKTRPRCTFPMSELSRPFLASILALAAPERLYRPKFIDKRPMRGK